MNTTANKVSTGVNTPTTMNANTVNRTPSNDDRISAALRWSAERRYKEDDQEFIITVHVRLSDDCNNKLCEFAVISDVYCITKNGRRVWVEGGCNHERILNHFPNLAPFAALHGVSWNGVPGCPVGNGYYFAHNSDRGAIEEYLRITPAEADTLRSAPDKAYFKYLLFNLGIVDRWHSEAAAAVAMLEEMTGKKFVNPYSPEVERSNLTYPDDERAEISAKIKAGYYTPVAIEERRKAEEAAKIDAERAKIIARADKAIKKATDEKNVMLFILSAGLSISNAFYYDHTNTVEFNWSNYSAKIAPADLDKLNNPDLDRSKLPEGIQFIISPKSK